MSYTIENLDQVLSLTARGQNTAAITKELHQIGTDVFRESQVNAPSDSGELQRSGRVANSARGKKATSDITYGSAGVDYASYVHEGTKAQASQPYLKEALDEVSPKITGRLEAAAQKSLKGIQ